MIGTALIVGTAPSYLEIPSAMDTDFWHSFWETETKIWKKKVIYLE